MCVFSEEYFDAYGAQRWWGENHDKIMELYTIHQENQPPTPTQSNEEVINLDFSYRLFNVLQ